MSESNPATEKLRGIVRERMKSLLKQLADDEPELVRSAIDETEGYGGLLHGLQFDLGEGYALFAVFSLRRWENP